jgi:uncharacterized membrane protein
VTWTAILILGAGSYLLKVSGLLVLGGRRLPVRAGEAAAALPVVLFVTLALVQSLSSDDSLVLNERAAGLATAAALAAMRAPVLVVIVAAAGVTALLRSL